MSDEIKILIVDDSDILNRAAIKAIGGIHVVGAGSALDLAKDAHDMLKCLDHPSPCHFQADEDPHNPSSQHAKKRHGKSNKNRYGSPFNIGRK